MIDKEACRLGREAARRLARRGGVEIAPGLTEAEFEDIERTYGTDIADYITNEFDGGHISADWTLPPLVPFWSDFL
ncbi:hypothetical protein ACIBI3_19935 [Actinomadura luteofluorescens]|uniref:hypothetical protein n=1 Tax=Actinomadura luteofluorescens TaxID=46163 RepID=UPI00347DA70A